MSCQKKFNNQCLRDIIKSEGQDTIQLCTKTMRKLLLSLTTVLMMSACGTSNYDIISSYQEQDSEARKLETVATAIIRPVVGDVQVGTEKIEDKWKFSAQQYANLGYDLQSVQNRGLYLSTKKHNADIIVAPIFNFERIGEGESAYYELSITGYLGNFTNWKPMEAKDSTWMRANKLYNVKVEDPYKNNK